MSEHLPQQSAPFTGRMATVLIIVALLSLGAVLALMAWSPDLVSRDKAGSTPYSRSSTGYAGLVDMLEARGDDVSISRLSQSLEIGGRRLLIATLSINGRDIEPDEISGPALIILPKWTYRENPAKRSWEIDADLASAERAMIHLREFDEDGEIVRRKTPGALETPFGRFRPDFEDEMQLIETDLLEPVISARGGALLAKVPGREIYILSDPDLLNNFGLARLENAKTGLGLIDEVGGGGTRPIVFDATVHGFERSTNLLKILLDIPYLGATLIALATMFLIGWAAAIRFGAPERETRAILAGKRALADNSAGLIAMAKRERRMAPGYLSLSRRALSRELGLPRTLSEDEYIALLDRMAKQNGMETSFTELQSGLSSSASSRDDLTNKARALWRWRKEMTHEQ
ncbi:DUF4350 domain-containing protein [Henriciella marina]|uniref:DUF4350 domain-containing protein n=1 Tax=Henriciella marina TaxID=453851 RepID=UPI00037A4E71|nr:hypothetical protein [Henriciella marina]